MIEGFHGVDSAPSGVASAFDGGFHATTAFLSLECCRLKQYNNFDRLEGLFHELCPLDLSSENPLIMRTPWCAILALLAGVQAIDIDVENPGEVLQNQWGQDVANTGQNR
ncbi:hypothetical protein BDV34DRAFT_86646 [Aspergillus parasiticus]|uniref:Uncharacterized protein n=1 Tax=Aspergillus parasiticus TaxID=5067 RepID=A0A5N6E565_ASPPA|nr:hypothetical protein BDV34DRAFT_86646 [Aspergillus parasiticus]